MIEECPEFVFGTHFITQLRDRGANSTFFLLNPTVYAGYSVASEAWPDKGEPL